MQLKLVPPLSGVFFGLLAMVSTGQTSLAQSATHTVLAPAQMTRIGSVSERFQSYNIDMLEVTGGKQWRPYSPELAATLKKKPRLVTSPNSAETRGGINPDLYAYRRPINLDNQQLRKLAAALGPAYLRVSGKRANTVFFADDENPQGKAPPGFNGILTRAQWRGVIDFARATDAEIIASFAVSPGTRDSNGVWIDDQAQRLIKATAEAGGKIAAAEFMSEPTLATMSGAPAHYNANAFGRDFERFRAFASNTVPDMKILGPGSVGETAGGMTLLETLPTPAIPTPDLLATMKAPVDGFSYHHYAATSRRCPDLGPQTLSKSALTEEWLAATDVTLDYYKGLRDRFDPNAPLWLTETADAVCGGNPWAATFLDTFRYLDQLGRLARRGVQVVAHKSLAANDYGLLDEDSLKPRPNYWGALLWRQLMGTTVLDGGKTIVPDLHLYAHCMRGKPGGVAALLINTDRVASYPVDIAAPAKRYTLSASKLQSPTVQLNDVNLELTGSGDIPAIKGQSLRAGLIELEPATITFITMDDADNPACR